MNKKVILFSRSQLPFLYGGISYFLETDNIEVIHIAYSNTEYEILYNNYGIHNIHNFKDEVKKVLSEQTKQKINRTTLLAEIDSLFIEMTDGRFNLNAAIQSDRAFTTLNYTSDEIFDLIIALYIYWNDFFKKNQNSLFIHEPVSNMFNQLAYILNKKYMGEYICLISVPGNYKFNFVIVDGNNGLSKEIKTNINYANSYLIDEKAIKRLRDKMTEETVFLANSFKKDKLSLLLVKSIFKLLPKKKSKNTVDYIDNYILSKNNSYVKLKNHINYKLKLKYDFFDKKKKYFYYPLHLEPEAVVLYWGDGLYKNQIKLIENIAAQLPPNTFLYIKDHPHQIGYRGINDYIYLQKLPNVQLINPIISGRELVKYSEGVVTLNGSAGFEALFYKKNVFMFGSSFYKNFSNIKYIENIKELRVELYNKQIELNDINKDVKCYLHSIHKGMVDFYGNRHNTYDVNHEENYKNIASALVNYLLFND